MRAATRKGKGKVKGIREADSPTSDFDIVYKMMPEYVVSFRRLKDGKAIPCVRLGAHGPVVNKKFWWRTGREKAVYGSHVYKVILSSSRHEAWKKPVESWIVAPDVESVKKALEWRFSFIVKKDVSLGKAAWSRAMALTSDRPAKIENSAKSKVLNENIVVTKDLDSNFIGSEGRFSITVSDKLNFADKAMKNGQQEVVVAMAKASNSTNAIINNYIDKHKDDMFNDTADVEKWDRIFPKEWFED